MSEEQARIKSENLPAPDLGPSVSFRPEYAAVKEMPSGDPSMSSSQRGESSMGPSPRCPVQKHYWTKEEVSSLFISNNTMI